MKNVENVPKYHATNRNRERRYRASTALKLQEN
jgi:hypothetical protein